MFTFSAAIYLFVKRFETSFLKSQKKSLKTNEERYKYLFSFFYQVDLQKMLWFLMQKKFRYNFCMYCDVFRQIRV